MAAYGATTPLPLRHASNELIEFERARNAANNSIIDSNSTTNGSHCSTQRPKVANIYMLTLYDEGGYY
eukprot:SAG31_NODE_8701_length_1403_cov_1.196319_1_plen_68_part_00